MTATRFKQAAAAAIAAWFSAMSWAAPTVTRLTPPSELFASGQPDPVIARFLPGQRFDLQATLRPDDASRTISEARFAIDGKPVQLPLALRDCASGCVKDLPANATIATVRAVSVSQPGVHVFSVTARQSDGQSVSARGNFEVVAFARGGSKVRNVIILLGDGMGIAHRTAARIMASGYAQGKARTPLAMDTFPVTALVKTASLNSIITDSSPGMSSYVSGNKNSNNQEGVFPDDTTDVFDNPRVEYLSEYMHRSQGKVLGLVTTSDVFDATPAANAVHTAERGAGTGIVDQYLDDRSLHGLTVLMGGGRKWFLPEGNPGSARANASDYAFSASDPHTAEIVNRWKAAPGALDAKRDLVADFQSAGFRYAATKTELDGIDAAQTDRLLGLFALSNMNVALDKINGRRGVKDGVKAGSVVEDFGLPDQPMLDEMAAKALAVLSRHKNGFVLMVEGASIDKQSHLLDTERWILDTIEFDRAVRVAKEFAERTPGTLVIVTADHECGGVAIIGASQLPDAELQDAGAKGGGAAALRDRTVGIYEQAGFPRYALAPDGYPVATDVDRRMLIGYAANADRYEDWRTNALPLQDSQQPFVKTAPLASHPAGLLERDKAGGFLITGQVRGSQGVHTATDIPLSAFGPGALAFGGVIDNTDVFFKIAQAMTAGAIERLPGTR
ncbi:MAG TPA: alkaline phosphatase [Burkholderiales bacterium]